MYLILEPMPAPVEEPVVAGTCVVVVVAPVEFMLVELVEEEEFMVCVDSKEKSWVVRGLVDAESHLVVRVEMRKQ
jgi:hypothetical protein